MMVCTVIVLYLRVVYAGYVMQCINLCIFLSYDHLTNLLVHLTLCVVSISKPAWMTAYRPNSILLSYSFMSPEACR